MSDMWDSVAPGWEQNADAVDEQLRPATGALLDAGRIARGDAVLDLATGPGGAGLAALARVGPSGRVVLSDSAPEMVAVAIRRASGSEQVRTAVFDQSSITFEDASFDAVINRHGLMFVEEPVAAVVEAVRVLRPGGRYATMTWDQRDRNPWLGLLLDAVGEQFGISFPPPRVRGPFTLQDADGLTSVLEGGGLQHVTVEAVPAPMRAASLEQWWERVPRLAGPLAMALAGMEPDVRQAIAERAMRAGAEVAISVDGGIEMAGSALIGSGQKAPD